ncbi:LysR family transcriptional regulator [Stutzerimonas nitrititolerans]|uniref:LysR family transcriptional regulator n=1 Tax=Stutzerimonas nitrititolerans TaxID=2482751 RepID=UPI0028B13946|nr:LysR family transcriptional regulator [Stutzerimonas nitrititolerans]
MIRLQDVDMNLLVVFQLLYRERKTQAVADELGLTQPAVSHALRRLRNLLGDELFERTSRGLRPTPYAERIAEPVNYALATLHESLNIRDIFDPASSTRNFNLAMTDIGEIYFLPKLMVKLAELAPGVSLSTERESALNLKDAMESGAVDLAIGLLPQLGAGYFQRRLFEQHYVSLMRKGHPLAEGAYGVDEFIAAKHAVVIAAGTGHGQVEELLARSGVPRFVQLTQPHFVAVPYIVSATDLVVTVTNKLAEATMERFELVMRPHPIDLPRVQINMFWHRRFHQDAGNRWLRGLIFEMFAE